MLPAEGAPPTPDELGAIDRHLVELARLSGAATVRDEHCGADLVLHPRAGLSLNYATRPRWTAHDLDERLERTRVRLRASGARPQLVVSDMLATPSDLVARLLTRGWVTIARESILWTRRPAVVPHLDPSLRLEAVTGRSAAEHEAAERRIFGIPPELASDRLRTLTDALAANQVRAYLVRLRGEPVATARLSVFEGLAAIHGIGVVPEHRRAGFGTLVTTISTRAGLALGARLAWLSVAIDNDAARPLYAGLGFRPAFDWQRLVDAGDQRRT